MTNIDEQYYRCIIQQIAMLKNYYAMICYDFSRKVESMEGRKATRSELKAMSDEVETINKVYIEITDMIEGLQGAEKFQRKLESKKRNIQSN